MECDNCAKSISSWSARYGKADTVFCKQCFKTTEAKKIEQKRYKQAVSARDKKKKINKTKIDSDEKFLSTSGRIRRSTYFFRTLFLTVPPLLFTFLLQNSQETNILLIEVLVLFIFGILQIIQAIKRLHDINLEGAYVLLGFIPIVNFAFGLYILFKDSTRGSNKYGEDPKKNERSSKNTSKSIQSTITKAANTFQNSSNKKRTRNYDLNDLEKLAELRDKGIITEKEFNLKKKQILDL